MSVDGIFFLDPSLQTPNYLCLASKTRLRCVSLLQVNKKHLAETDTGCGFAAREGCLLFNESGSFDFELLEMWSEMGLLLRGISYPTLSKSDFVMS